MRDGSVAFLCICVFSASAIFLISGCGNNFNSRQETNELVIHMMTRPEYMRMRRDAEEPDELALTSPPPMHLVPIMSPVNDPNPPNPQRRPDPRRRDMKDDDNPIYEPTPPPPPVAPEKIPSNCHVATACDPNHSPFRWTNPQGLTCHLARNPKKLPYD